jgi:hypothetical protein
MFNTQFLGYVIIYLCINLLAVSNSDYIASNEYMIAHNNLKMMWKEAVIALHTYYSRCCLEGICQDSRCSEQNLKWGPSEYKFSI